MGGVLSSSYICNNGGLILMAKKKDIEKKQKAVQTPTPVETKSETTEAETVETEVVESETVEEKKA